MIPSDTILLAVVIFALRLLNSAVGTIRLVILNRNRKFLAAVLAFFESLIFAITVATVVADLTNILILVAYCGGFSIGQYVGLWIEGRFITSYMSVNIVPHNGLGHNIAVALRNQGFGVTETVGMGRDGEVTTLRSVAQNKNLPHLLKIVHAADAEAFVSIEEARTVSHGWLSTDRGQLRSATELSEE
ncbi:MAG: DUF2179 domain-containing protein [Burkholderiales bacterium]|nr:DUF2179 domain-containing protein [Anaerolineae bacterium]